MTYRLFGEAADRYDWHTPPHHYQHDHAFVLSHLPRLPGKVLDVGCGTGVFLEKAGAADFDAVGIDASPQMVSIASNRVGKKRVRLQRMQDLSEDATYNAIVSLSWTFNYVRSFREAKQVLQRFFIGLRPGGRLILQIAHAANASGLLFEDREPGQQGQVDDILFLYRFRQAPNNPGELWAQYVYGCKSRNELVSEEHVLHAADANRVAEKAAAIGYRDVTLFDSWRGDPFRGSIMPFLVADRPG